MKTVVQKWGNSLALRIPKAMAQNIQVHEGVSVEVIEKDGGLLIKSDLAKPSLKALLAKVTLKNIHTEVETGTSMGKEVW